MGDKDWSRRVKLLLLLCLTFPLLSGCWDRLEIEDRAVILGIGVDVSDRGAEVEEKEFFRMHGTLPPPKTGLLRITVQIAVPGRIPLGPGGGGGGAGGGGGGGQSTVWVVDSEGHTLDDAVNNLQQRVSAPLFFGHLRVIVVSEVFAQKGIENLNDFFRRNAEVRRANWMFICQGKAFDVMKASPQLERVPTLYLMNTMEQSVKMGRFPNDFLGVFWSATSAKGREGYLPYLVLKGQETVELGGIAYFKNDKMVGLTNTLEITLFMGLTGVNVAGGQGFVNVPGTSEYVLFGGRNRKTSFKTEIRNGKPHITVYVHIEGNILEKSNESVTLKHEVIKQIESQLQKDIVKSYQALVKKTQDKGADIFGYGEQFRAKHPQYWNREIKTKAKWQETYAELSVEIKADINIRRIGMKAT
ncbi:Ger(x)C family spore germination protein [Paenibacillus radicis (ex Xue et al. 2023)]|uniref:Ger(X)C family spore germination protein n=1 Tax=Paenibacillus radicis (ex Xue et al. 2023) TaxID=2972489 RepID=A0ABT1YNJ5_9BACL|nr:Ger(x)C family spore germination protein [Paenibacillus radicis (ex Xue et al. 2023)]MCR8634742.1 Ger(x)C family spore germination protein [Paenibacillus radicis (ex Xue et al. 2023)]